MKGKISISTLFLIIAIIIIAIMGYFIYNISNDKKISDGQTQNLSAQINSLENTVHTLENTISKSSEDSADSTSECQKVLEKYLNLHAISEGAPESLLVELDLMKSEDFDYQNTIENDKYVLTKVKFKDFENEMLKYATKDLLNEWNYKNSNGYVAVFNGGGSGATYTVKEMTLITSEENFATYSVEASYVTGEFEEEQNLTASFDLSNEKCVVSQVNYDN